MTLVSQNIKFLRNKMGYTQEQLSDKIGIKRSLLGAYEEGRADPRLANLLKMSEVFSIPVDHIISRDLQDPSSSVSGATTKGKEILAY